jgi:hypothetical protein
MKKSMLSCWNLDVFFSDKLVVVWKACSNGLIVLFTLCSCASRGADTHHAIHYYSNYCSHDSEESKIMTKVTTNCCSNNSWRRDCWIQFQSSASTPRGPPRIEEVLHSTSHCYWYWTNNNACLYERGEERTELNVNNLRLCPFSSLNAIIWKQKDSKDNCGQICRQLTKRVKIY